MAKPVKHYGQWRIRWIDAEGRRRSETHEDRAEAVRALRTHEAEADEIRRGLRRPEIADKTFEDLAKYWIECRIGGARNVGLLAVLYGCGLRRSEAVGLDLSDFDAPTGALTVGRAKGNKQRIVYLTNGARLALDAWLRFRGEISGPLFFPVTQAGVVTARRMSDQAVFDLVRRLARRAGVAKFGPHDLRRSHISDALDAGADISALAVLCGHSQVTTTSRYDRRGERARRRAAETIHVPFTPKGS
jgi:integrase